MRPDYGRKVLIIKDLNPKTFVLGSFPSPWGLTNIFLVVDLIRINLTLHPPDSLFLYLTKILCLEGSRFTSSTSSVSSRLVFFLERWPEINFLLLEQNRATGTSPSLYIGVTSSVVSFTTVNPFYGKFEERSPLRQRGGSRELLRAVDDWNQVRGTSSCVSWGGEVSVGMGVGESLRFSLWFSDHETCAYGTSHKFYGRG